MNLALIFHGDVEELSWLGHLLVFSYLACSTC